MGTTYTLPTPGLRRTTLISVWCAAFLAGIGLARLGWIPSIWTVLCSSSGLVVTARGRSRLVVVFALAGGLLLGCYRGGVYMQRLRPYNYLYQHTVSMRVVAQTDGVYSNEQLSFDASSLEFIEPYHQAVPGTMTIKGRATAVFRGDVLRVSGKLYKTRGASQAGISYATIEVLGRHMNLLDTMRLRFAAGVRNALPEPQASFGIGLLIGQKTALPKHVSDDLSRVGLTHIVAVSGYNLTIIIDIARRRLGRRSKYQATVWSLFLMGSFLLVTGFGASIVRAAIVSSISLWAWYYGRTIRPVLLILLAAALTAGWYPLYLWSDIGWYLSFFAFFGVLVLSPLLVQYAVRRNWLRANAMNLLIMESFCAQLMTLPIIMYIFHRLSAVGLLSNIVVVPLVPLGMLLSFAAGIAGALVPALGGWIGLPGRIILTYMLDTAHALAGWPHALIEQPISVAGMIACYLGIVSIVVFLWWRVTKNGTITDKERRHVGRRHMSGHSKWSTIKRQKGVKDAARGAVFTKLGNMIAVAARAGADPETNFALRLAIDKAKASNMPMANIQRAIDRVSDKSAAQLQEVMYEGYGPGGVAIIVEAATDNTNRTYPEVRLAFSKHGGNIAEKGAVAFQFDHKGMIRVRAQGDEATLQALEAGAEDVAEEDNELVIYTDAKGLAKVRMALTEAGLEVVDAELTYVPNTTIEVQDAATAGKIMRLMDALEACDDVTATHVNFDIADGIL